MRFREEYLEAAILDLIEIQAFYDTQQLGLGTRFQDAVTERIDLLLEFPEAAPVLSDKQARKVSLEQFPYYVVYTIRQDAVWIVAIVHQRRHPRYWVSRMRFLD
jgi:toxin ParE1/3/4